MLIVTLITTAVLVLGPDATVEMVVELVNFLLTQVDWIAALRTAIDVLKIFLEWMCFWLGWREFVRIIRRSRNRESADDKESDRQTLSRPPSNRPFNRAGVVQFA